MKKSIFAILIIAIAFTNKSFAQNFPGLDKSPMDVASYPSKHNISDKVVKITYSRPQLKGRSLEKLVPNDKKWRLGANEAAEISFYKDVIFGGKKIKAGTYTMYAIPGEKEWTIAISNQLNVWGAYYHKQENDVIRVKGIVSTSPKTYEAFSIAFGDDLTMYMAFGNTIVSVPIQ